MKKILYIFSFLTLFATAAFAQDEDSRNGEKIRERMREYIQKRLSLSAAEADRFAPLFLNYYNDQRNVAQQYRGDKLVLQQKIVDLRLRYRDQFKNIMGDKRSNQVFQLEHDFVNEVKQLRLERMQNRAGDRPFKRKGG